MVPIIFGSVICDMDSNFFYHKFTCFYGKHRRYSFPTSNYWAAIHVTTGLKGTEGEGLIEMTERPN